MSSKNGLKIHQPHKLNMKIKALTKRDVSFNAAACVCVALVCLSVLVTAPIAHTIGVRSAAVKQVAKSMAADKKDYAKLIKEYNELVDEYNGIADEYNDAKDAIAEADNVKSGIKDLNTQHDDLQKKVDAKKAELQSLTGQVDQAKKNSISDGVWQVGKDIDAGTYRATSEVGSHCYWSVTVSGSDDIVQNDIPGGGYPQVTVSDGQQLKLQDCGTFAKQ